MPGEWAAKGRDDLSANSVSTRIVLLVA